MKLAMANGHTLVLVDHDNIYEALYDVLNQRCASRPPAAKREARTSPHARECCGALH